MLSVASAEVSRDIDLSITAATSNIRSQAPIALDVHLSSWSGGLHEGQLLLECYDGSKLLTRVQSDEIVLSGGERHSRMMLPPLALSRSLSVMTVKAQFVGKRATHELATTELRVPTNWKRSFVIGVVHPDAEVSAKIGLELGTALRLDQTATGDSANVGFLTAPSVISPDQLRPDGLSLFALDVLGISGAGFAALESNQLTAICNWVEAGGSVLVVSDRPLTATQAQFLNRMASLPDNEVSQFLPSAGQPPMSTGTMDTTLQLHYPGLGRAAIVGMQPDSSDNSRWRQLSAHLWKIREKQRAGFVDTGRLRMPTQAELPVTFETDPYALQRPLQPSRLPASSSLNSILLPEKVQGIPFGVIVGILILFLAAIVPLDYLLLGYLKQRRYTWILLPATSVLFTLCTVLLSNYYLGSTDYRTSLDIVDLNQTNKVVRSSKFELLFTAKRREATTELTRSLFAPVTTIRANRSGDVLSGWTPSGNSGSSTTTMSESQAVYEGTMPTAYSAVRQMQKWSPQLSRHTHLRSDHQVPAIKWNVETSDKAPFHFGSSEWRQQLNTQLSSAVPDATVLFLNGGRIYSGSAQIEKSRPATNMDPKHARLLPLLRTSSERPANGLFVLVSQISPNGAGDLEDLAILDPTDTRQWLILIVTTEGNDFVVYRRLIRGAL